jgi:hypothetical protein
LGVFPSYYEPWGCTSTLPSSIYANLVSN